MVLCACGDGPQEVDSTVVSVVVTPATASFTSLGDTEQLSATARDASDNAIPGVSFTWSSSDENCAAVNSAGLVTSAGNGTATVTAAIAGVSGATSVTVAQVVAAVAVTPSPMTLTSIDETAQLTASAQDANGHEVAGQDFTWESSDGSVASVSLAGLVTAEANGTATVTATTDGVAGDAEVTVAQAAAEVEVSPTGASISGVGATQQFTVEAWDAGGNAIPDPSVTWTSLNPNVATIDPSTGQATAVESGQVTIAATANGMTGYALLTVAVPGAEPVNLWSEMLGGLSADAVWGSSATDIFAVSAWSTLHYDGTGWSTMATQVVNGRGVWGTSATDVYAVFSHGWIQHYDGTSWSEMESGTGTNLNGVWGTSPTDIYAVGDAGTILHYDGTTWSTMASGTFGVLRDVWGTSATNVFAVGDIDRILHYDGTSWSPMASGAFPDTRCVWGSSASNVFAVSYDGRILHYDGTSWTIMPGGTGVPLEAVWGTSNTDVYALGWWGAIVHYDGANWSEMVSGIGGSFYGVWGMSATDVYAVGQDDVILRGVRGASVVVTPSAHSLTAGGATVLLAAEARDADDNAISGVRFAWSSSDLSVATVDATGLVTAVTGGTAMISATVPGGAADTATITVDLGQAPTATITSPANGASFAEGATITFSGSGTDPEDGDLTGSALVWTSSLDGQIGTGTSFTRDDLSPGTHTTTLTTTDSDGGSGTASVTITVLGAGPIVPGDWQTTVAFGTVDFTVNAQSTAVTYIRFNVSGYACGNFSGDWTWTVSNFSQPIIDREFLIDVTFSNGDRLVFGGTFDETGTQASGTWQMTIFGNTCSGTWQGAPL
jgi:uncharacterized protein YjdB